MKNYISAREAAVKWGISLSRVHQYCQNGRIEGVRKYGNAWMIPENVKKPSDPRVGKKISQKNEVQYLTCGLLSFIIPMPKSHADSVLLTINDEKRKGQYKAELAYMRGCFEEVKRYYETVSPADETYFCAANITIAAAMSTGDYRLFKRINQAATETEKKAATLSARYGAELFRGLIATTMNAPEMAPEWLKNAGLDDFPSDSRVMMIFLRVKYLQGTHDFYGMLAAAQTARSLLKKTNEITTIDIYLTCLCGCANYAINNIDEARAYLDKAVAMSVPAGITAPLGEYTTWVGGMLEIALKKAPAGFEKAVLGHIEETLKNWLFFHNEFARDNASLILTTREYQLAVLLKEGKTYEQAAKQLCLSVGRVRNLISVIYEKLGVSKKSEMVYFVY